MRRFFVENIDFHGGPFTIKGDEAWHISKVLRLKRGESIILFDGKGNSCISKIESVSPEKVMVSLARPLFSSEKREGLSIVLCQSIIKSNAMDLVIQKSSELGVTEIIPFYSERTVVRIGREGKEKKRERWRKISINAAKQSEREVPAQVHEIVSFDTLIHELALDEDSLKIILWEREESKDIKSILRAYPTRKVVCMVGPEGGFSRNEVDLSRKAGFMPVSLGRRILRAETAAMVITALVQYEFGGLSVGPAQGGHAL